MILPRNRPVPKNPRWARLAGAPTVEPAPVEPAVEEKPKRAPRKRAAKKAVTKDE